MSYKKDVIVLGFGTFAFLFGAGNIIFPPTLGILTGAHWSSSLVGFIITDVILSFIAMIAFNKYQSFENFSGAMGKRFIHSYVNIIIVVVLCGLIVPRTAAVTYEIAIKPFFPSLPSYLFYIIYFIITALLALKPSKIFDNIGKIMSPLIVIFIVTIIFAGVYKLPVQYHKATEPNPFSYGFITGYQTIDALAAFLQAGFAISVLKLKGYNDIKVRQRMLIKAGIIASILLTIIYAGLTYLGAILAYSIPKGFSNTQVLIQVVNKSLPIGHLLMSFSVFFSCLTTAIGDVSLTSFLLSKEGLHKKRYLALVFFFSAVGVFMAQNGVDQIILIANPILKMLYPVLMILIFLNLMNIRDALTVRFTAYSSFIFCLIDAFYNDFGFKSLEKIFFFFPFAKQGFAFLVPCLIIFIITHSITRFNKKN